jgi:hypothetical protein
MPLDDYTAMAGMKRGRPVDDDDDAEDHNLDSTKMLPSWFGMHQEKVTIIQPESKV